MYLDILLAAQILQKLSPGSIRGYLGLTVGRNIIHGSDSLESAEREINLWFNENEITSYASPRDAWLYE